MSARTPGPWTWQDGSLYAADDEIVAIGNCDISLARDIALGMWDQDGIEGFAMKPADEAFILEAANNYERVLAERDAWKELAISCHVSEFETRGNSKESIVTRLAAEVTAKVGTP